MSKGITINSVNEVTEADALAIAICAYQELKKENEVLKDEAFYLLHEEDNECNFHETSKRRERRKAFLRKISIKSSKYTKEDGES